MSVYSDIQILVHLVLMLHGPEKKLLWHLNLHVFSQSVWSSSLLSHGPYESLDGGDGVRHGLLQAIAAFSTRKGSGPR